MKKDAKNNEKTITLWEIMQKIEITKETWQKIASMLASLIVLDCEKKEVKNACCKSSFIQYCCCRRFWS